MASFNKFISSEIVDRAWQQILKSLVNDEGRIKQLFSMKPIDLYETTTSLQVSGATVKMEIKSYLENMLKKNERSESRIWPFGKWGTQESLKYKFNVVVNGKMDFRNVEIWVKNNFKDKLYSFRNGRYHLRLQDVRQVGERGGKLFFELDLSGSIRFWFLRIRMKSRLTFEMIPVYDHKKYLIRVKDLDYHFNTANILLKLFDRHYHDEFQRYLESLIEITIKEDLFTARILAQEQMNKHQRDENLIFNGYLNDLELERIQVEKRGIEAVFHAQGNIQLTR